MVPNIKVKLSLLLVISILLGINKLQAQTVDITLSAPITTAQHISASHSITLSNGFSANGANGPIILDIVAPSLFNCTLLIAVPTASQNYVSTYIPRVPLTDAATIGAHTACEVNQSIQYFDGLGRPLQMVQVKANPDGTKDMIQPIAYDLFGREATKYLPYTSGTSATVLPGSYRSDALTALAGQSAFYATPPTGVSIDTIPSASTAFEASPLNRVTEQGAPGTDWQLGRHTNKVIYASNDGTTYWAKQFGVDTSGALVYQGNYAANQLFVTVSQDENWMSTQTNLKLNTTEEYKDKEGHVILKRTYNSNASTTPATPETLSTYYVYDDFGNLSYVLPPKAEADGTTASNPIAQTTIDNLCYQYQYDERNRLIKKRIPGKDWEYMVYNKLDQVVATQDGNQRVKKQWVITKYDALGRTILTGLWNSNTAIGQPALKALVYAQTSQWENRDNAQTYGYTLTNTYPTSLNTVLSVNYYDDYTIPGLPTKYKPTQQSSMTKGLVTATRATVLNTINNTTPDMLWTVNYYDDKGRISDAYVQHYLGGVADTSNYDHIVNTYDFTNAITNTTRTHYTKANTTTPAVTIANVYVYDHMGRKRQSFEQINGGTNVLLNQTDYNEIGQLLTKHLHSENSGASFLQNITYVYNERGWLTNSASPLFAMQLKYNDGTTPQYNGNIANQYWGTPGSLTNNFTYSYDALNRITAGAGNTGNTESNINYDKMGNITKLNRYLKNTLIDSLAYTYTTASGTITNQIQQVVDASPDTSIRGYKAGTYSYVYDVNGNMRTDNSKGLTVTYNLLNLPETNTQTKGTITYTYDATGRKLRKVSTFGTGSSTDYISGIQYTKSVIDFIQTEEGRVLYNNGNLNYEYNLADHLGDTRLTFDTQGGLARTTQQTDYMPFGMEITVGSIISPKNEYLYNGKELQEELGVYDYGHRMYDPVIGRFTTIDPHADKHLEWSPFAYVYDDPIKHIDPDGQDGIVIAFPDYKITVGPVKLPYLGHAGVLLINNKTGATKYYEYGRYDKDGKGIVRNVAVSDLKIGKDGKPTAASLNKVMGQISKNSGEGGKIEGAYIKSDDYKGMVDYANGRKAENDDKDRKPYSLTSNSCITFATDVVKQDPDVAKEAPSNSMRPIGTVSDYQDVFPAVRYDPKTNKTTVEPDKKKQ